MNIQIENIKGMFYIIKPGRYSGKLLGKIKYMEKGKWKQKQNKTKI